MHVAGSLTPIRQARMPEQPPTATTCSHAPRTRTSCAPARTWVLWAPTGAWSWPWTSIEASAACHADRIDAASTRSARRWHTHGGRVRASAAWRIQTTWTGYGTREWVRRAAPAGLSTAIATLWPWSGTRTQMASIRQRGAGWQSKATSTCFVACAACGVTSETVGAAWRQRQRGPVRAGEGERLGEG